MTPAQNPAAPRRRRRRRLLLPALAIALAALVLLWILLRRDPAAPAAAPPPVLAVQLVQARWTRLPLRIAASGSIAAWQEASVGAEADGLRLVEVKVNVGDVVRRGQLLARFSPDLIAAELAEADASVAQAEADASAAEADARRAASLERSGALSAQQISQYQATAAKAGARLQATRATRERQRLRLAQTRVLAPGDGVISARSATEGAVVPAGQELFRLIRDGRLEWRAAVGAADLARLAPGQAALITVTGQADVAGRLRQVAPAISSSTQDGLAYVDLPSHSGLRAGSFARGHFRIGDAAALTLPQQAVLLRDGYSYVMRLDAASRVLLAKVSLGRRDGGRVEISAGLTADEPVIAAGLGFLGEGDTVSVVGAAAGGSAP